MPALRFFNIFLFISPALLCFTGIATAAEQTYVREYIYQASEADSKLSTGVTRVEIFNEKLDGTVLKSVDIHPQSFRFV